MKTRLDKMAELLGCSVEQINSQFKKNARQLRAMEAEAIRKGKKINGCTADDLSAMALSYEQRIVKNIPTVPNDGRERSRTFTGIAQAMAEQWTVN